MSMTWCYLYVMGCKKTYTYATDPKIKEKAERKAKRDKTTLSEKIDQLLKEYVSPNKASIELDAKAYRAAIQRLYED